jgi:hypothetical protein
MALTGAVYILTTYNLIGIKSYNFEAIQAYSSAVLCYLLLIGVRSWRFHINSPKEQQPKKYVDLALTHIFNMNNKMKILLNNNIIC